MLPGLVLVLSACTGDPIEPPALLAPVSGGTGLSATAGDRLVVALGDGGAALIDARGRSAPLSLPGGPVRDVEAAGAAAFLVRGDDAVRYHPAADAPAALSVAGPADDIAVGCDGALFLSRGARVYRFRVDDETLEAFGPPLPGLRGVERLDCERLITFDDDEVHVVNATSATRLVAVTGPVHAVATRLDGSGAIAVAHGAPPRLTNVSSAGVATEHRRVPAVRDLYFGPGGAFATDHLYVLDDEGVGFVAIP